MICLEELLAMKDEFEKEKIFVDAKILVVSQMIEKEKAKEVVEPDTNESV